MGETTGISWVERTWSPWFGCAKVSPACDGCYAEHLMDHRFGRVKWGANKERARSAASSWARLDSWSREGIERGRQITVFPSLCDPFDIKVSPAWHAMFWRKITATPGIRWILLTKRPQNILRIVQRTGITPTSNIALGVTCEDQTRWGINVPHLLAAGLELSVWGQQRVPLFVSAEPLLEGLMVDQVFVPEHLRAALCMDPKHDHVDPLHRGLPSYISWIITGGETDQGEHKARPSNPQWFRSIRDACASHGTAYHHKQHGAWADYSQIPRSRAWEFTRKDEDGAAFGRLMTGYNESPPHEVLFGGKEFETRHCFATRDGDPGPCMVRVGPKLAGRLLDGRSHDDLLPGVGA